jgi:glycosyltransferase involved in cell wall biosynthesis
MILSVLIPTINGREVFFTRILEKVNDQKTEEIEIISLKDNKEISIGSKRQQLLEKASGEYVVFIDDDDLIADDYINSILDALLEKPDCVGFEINCTGTLGKTASVSNRWSDWGENKEGYDYVRTPYHKVPIKKDIALAIGFKDLRYAEDYDFSKRLKQSGLIKKEIYISKVLYYYLFVYENPKTKYNT